MRIKETNIFHISQSGPDFRKKRIHFVHLREGLQCVTSYKVQRKLNLRSDTRLFTEEAPKSYPSFPTRNSFVRHKGYS